MANEPAKVDKAQFKNDKEELHKAIQRAATMGGMGKKWGDKVCKYFHTGFSVVTDLSHGPDGQDVEIICTPQNLEYAQKLLDSLDYEWQMKTGKARTIEVKG